MLSWIARLAGRTQGPTAVDVPPRVDDGLVHPARGTLAHLLTDDLGYNDRARLVAHLKVCPTCCEIVAKALRDVPRQSRRSVRQPGVISRAHAVVMLVIALGLMFVVYQLTPLHDSINSSLNVPRYDSPFAPQSSAASNSRQSIHSSWLSKLFGEREQPSAETLWYGGLIDEGADWRWRITAGALERAPAGGGQWQQVKVRSGISLNTVAVAGNDVWVGGRPHLLYKSSNAGADWHNVDLTDDGVAENDDISSIRFIDSQHGFVVTIAGNVWRTDDGGNTWRRQ